MILCKLSQLIFIVRHGEYRGEGDSMGKDKMDEIDIFIDNLKNGRPFLTEKELEIVKKRYPGEFKGYMKKKEYTIDGERYYFIKL